MTRRWLRAGLPLLLPLLPLLACTGPSSNLHGGLLGASNFGGSASATSDGSDSNSGNSSGNSGNSSGNSANSSGNSADSSGNSSAGSNNSSQGSANSTGNTAAGVNGSADSTANSANASLAGTSQGSADSTAQSTRVTGPVLSTVAVGVTVVGVGYLIWGNALRASTNLPPPVQPAPPPPAAAPAAAQFLRASERQLRMDLAVGAGPSIEDLASMAEIRKQNLPRFGRLLRDHRDQVLTWSDPRSITPELAVRVLQRIGEIAAMDSALAEDRRSFHARHSGT